MGPVTHPHSCLGFLKIQVEVCFLLFLLQPMFVLATLLSVTVISCYICSKCKICLSFSGIGNMRLKFLRRNELRGAGGGGGKVITQ